MRDVFAAWAGGRGGATGRFGRERGILPRQMSYLDSRRTGNMVIDTAIAISIPILIKACSDACAYVGPMLWDAVSVSFLAMWKQDRFYRCIEYEKASFDRRRRRRFFASLQRPTPRGGWRLGSRRVDGLLASGPARAQSATLTLTPTLTLMSIVTLIPILTPTPMLVLILRLILTPTPALMPILLLALLLLTLNLTLTLILTPVPTLTLHCGRYRGPARLCCPSFTWPPGAFVVHCGVHLPVLGVAVAPSWIRCPGRA